MGDSRATWDGDTLVVDVVHFNDQTWFDRAGNHHSEQLHVVERYTPIDRDHINYEVTIEDPKVFTRSWKMSMPLCRRVDRNMQLLEHGVPRSTRHSGRAVQNDNRLPRMAYGLLSYVPTFPESQVIDRHARQNDGAGNSSWHRIADEALPTR